MGIRLKGWASFQPLDQKPAFKIKFDEFVDGQELLGLERLTLNNMVQDSGMVRERLGYRYLRGLGIPAPLCNHARVYVNEIYYGLYANLQTLDKTFVNSLFDPAPRNLFDSQVDVIVAQIESAALEDTRKPYSNDDFYLSIDGLRQFFEERGGIVDEQLALEGF